MLSGRDFDQSNDKVGDPRIFLSGGSFISVTVCGFLNTPKVSYWISISKRLDKGQLGIA
jgi:hypothetical protein